MFGFINVYKPKGLTSFDVVYWLRKVLKIKQIGHTGTLDPLAEGVLPVCIGKATKLIDYLQEDKAYEAELKFGFVSNTYDKEGEVTKFADKKVNKNEIETALEFFRGEIEQIPPIFSAIKIKGKKLYEYARSGKTAEEVDIPARKVIVSRVELIDFDETEQTARIVVECSKGTYIRSIVHDLGQRCECGAVMTNLVRTKSGKFTLNTAVNLDELTSTDTIVKNLINPLDVLSYKCIELNEAEYSRIITGQRINSKGIQEGEIVLLTKDSAFISIARVEQEKIKVIKVFV